LSPRNRGRWWSYSWYWYPFDLCLLSDVVPDLFEVCPWIVLSLECLLEGGEGIRRIFFSSIVSVYKNLTLLLSVWVACPSIKLNVSIWGCRYRHCGPFLQYLPNLHPVMIGVVSRFSVGSILHFGRVVSFIFSKWFHW
jgi:hypothetical protein